MSTSSDDALFKLTLDDWADKLWGLYKDHNLERLHPEIWLAVMQYASEIAEGIRRAEYQRVRTAIAHTFSWMCAFYNQCTKPEAISDEGSVFVIKEKFWQVIAFKFPDVCGRCRASPCACGSARVAVDFEEQHTMYHPELTKLRGRFNGSSYTLKTWGEMFAAIFGNSIYRFTIETIGFHLMEEAGEVSKVIRKLVELQRLLNKPDRESTLEKCKLELDNLKEEIADTFSFLYALSAKVAFIATGMESAPDYQDRLGFAEQYLMQTLVANYRDPDKPGEIRCFWCRANPCVCEPYIVE